MNALTFTLTHPPSLCFTIVQKTFLYLQKSIYKFSESLEKSFVISEARKLYFGGVVENDFFKVEAMEVLILSV